MKRKLRKSLSWLLTVAMIFSLFCGMIPTASAVDSEGITDITGDGVYGGRGNVEFRLYTTDAYKLLKLADPTITADTTINSVTLLLEEEYLGSNRFTLTGGLGTKIPTNRFTNSIANTNDKANPSNITGIEITYDGEKTVTIQASDLRLESDIVTTPGVEWNAVYEIKSSNDEKCVVAFYDNGETDAGAIAGYELYAVRIVNSGSTVGKDDFPPAPEHISYSFVSWNDKPDGEGTPFDYDTVVTSDMNIYARNVSGLDVHTGTVIHVMNEDNALLNRYIELYNEDPNNEDISLADFTQDVMDSMKVTIHGEGTEATNPDYWLSGLEGQHNGWIDDDYFLVLNYNAELLPEGHYHNTHIPATEISGITVEATIDGKTVSVYISRGSEEGQISVAPTDIATEWKLVLKGSSSPSEGNDITSFSKELVRSAPVDVTGIPADVKYPAEGTTVEVPESGSVTLLYKFTVTGDEGASYTISDGSAEAVAGYSLSGTISGEGNNIIYATKTFSAADVLNGALTNTATIEAGADTEVTDENTDDDTATVPAVIKPDGPTEGELNTIFNDQIRVICANNHRTADYSPSDVANGVTAGTVTKNEDGAWICEVTIDKDAFAGKYGSDLGETHALAESETASEKVTLVYSEGTWTTSATLPITVNVVCTNPDVDAIQVTMSDGVRALYESIGITNLERWIHVDRTAGGYYEMGSFNGWHAVNDVSVDEISGVTLGYTTSDTRMWFPIDRNNGIYAQLEVSYGYTYHSLDPAEIGSEYYTLILHCQLVEERPEEPDEPNPPDLGGIDQSLLNNKITVACTTNENHDDAQYGWIAGGIDTNNAEVTAGANGTYTYEVTVVAGPYVTKYNENTTETHTNPTFEDSKNTITLTWTPNADGTGGSWKADNGVTIVVKCAAPETPTLKHTVKVSVENGTASFAGQSGVTEFSVLDGEDAVITFTPKEGYVLESATIDDDDYTIFFNEKGETTYTLKTIGDDMTVVVVYKLDIPTPTFEDDLAGQNIEVLVKCTSDTAVNHWSKDYLLEKHAVSEPDLYEKDGEYFADFTVYAASYVDRYNVDGSYTGNDKHSTTDSGQATITLVWNAKDEEWACITPADKVITFLVKCGASDTPELPTIDEILDVLYTKPVLVKCMNENREHEMEDEEYAVLEGTYKIGPLQQDENGDWTCYFEVNAPIPYLKQFINNTDSTQHMILDSNSQQILLVLNDGDWSAPNPDQYITTIEVTCDPTVVGSYDLTFNANGGFFGSEEAYGKEIYVKEDLVAGEHTLSSYVRSEDLVYSSTGEKVIFAGWTTEPQNKQVYRYNDADIPEIVETVTIEDQSVIVWAVWGYDEDEDGVADINEIVITPADIAIYTGGSNYKGDIVDENGNELTGSDSYNGFPEPGFYITLPTALNNQLQGDATGPVDLSNVLSFVYEAEGQAGKTWTLQMYNPESPSNIAFSKYVYRMIPAEDQEPVRLQIEGDDGPISDDKLEDFGTNNLFETYTMSIYGGDVKTDAVKAQLTISGVTQSCDIYVDSGELTVRGTTGSAETVAINDSANDANGFQATAAGSNNYYINGSNIEVAAQDVHLLTDELTGGQEQLNQLQEKAEDALNSAGITETDGLTYDFMYLDLVDSSNGNAYVTMQGTDAVTIHWPMPTNADPETIHVVHFDGLDRNYTDVAGSIETCKTSVLGTDRDEDGNITFTTRTFSPFALVYETKDPGTGPDTDPDDDKDDDDHYTGGGGNDNDSDPTGNLSIELDVNGGDDSFTFTVYLTDKDGDDLKNNFYFNGDFTGTIGSGDEITLEGGDKIVIRNLPEGTRYEVIIETADGYTYVIDGEEGIIRTGTNEAEFTATRTVPLADPSVTGVSRWLNVTDHIAYLTGYPGGAFGPDNSMTRAEVAQMFYALLNNKNVTITKTFPDVPANAWYATAVNTLASLGMVSGDANGNYRPNDPITRAEFCVIALAFAYEPDNAVCYFSDVSRSDWFYTYVAQAASYGWIGGYTNGNFGPNDRITRAQVTTIVNNMLGRAADRDYVIDHQADLVQFTDLNRTYWGYYQIMEATNAHDYTKSNGTENWR